MFVELLENIEREIIPIDDLRLQKNKFNEFAISLISGTNDHDVNEVNAFIKICLDYYVYSSTGDVLISDNMYDQCIVKAIDYYDMYTSPFPSPLGKKKWELVPHGIRGMVGSLDKIYEYEELEDYLSKYRGIKYFVLAPKYDGISCSIEIRNGKIIRALTRYDGILGQDITRVIINASNIDRFIIVANKDGYYKCELCVSAEDFEKLLEIRTYENRRSATSGICNTPSNLHLAKYISIIPLAYYNDNNDTMKYIATDSKIINNTYTSEVFDDMNYMLECIRDRKYPYRVDGVVLSPIFEGDVYPVNLEDILHHSIAYKCNTSEGKTKIEYGYYSVGRSGKAIPMLRVEPVEVNETIVRDVSLGSYNKYISMGLLNDDEVVIYSAGDVIPQIRLPQVRVNIDNDKLLRIPKKCPYCGSKFERISNELYCTNPDCIRVVTGKVINFLSKLGLEGFSDTSIETIYKSINIRRIDQYLNLTKDQLALVDGFAETSINNFISEMKKIKETPIELSKFIGSLGIDNIGERKCRKIFDEVSLDRIIVATGDKLIELTYNIQAINGIGPKTAKIFVEFIKANLNEIKVLYNLLTIKADTRFKGNIVFTGFRDSNLEKMMYSYGYSVSNTITSETFAVITVSIEKKSTKCKEAIRRGIPIYQLNSLSKLFAILEGEDAAYDIDD